ncbi:MAG: hypothetical protein IJY23_01950, partial [Clostridia bacterium]|nr:hypothetical protein [Clostridia bacterium]
AEGESISKQLKEEAKVASYDLAKSKAEMLNDAKAANREAAVKSYDAHIAKRADILGKAEMLLAAKQLEQTSAATLYDNASLKAERKKAYKTAAAASDGIVEIFAKSTNKKLQRLEMLEIATRHRDDKFAKLYRSAMEKQAEKDADKDTKRSMIRDYEDNAAISLYNKKHQSEYPIAPENSTEARLIREELLREATKHRESEDMQALARRDFRRYMKDEKHDEKSIIKDIKRTRAGYDKTSVKSYAMPRLRESIGFSRELLERYADVYSAALAVRDKKYIKLYKKKVLHATDEYRADLEFWTRVTGEATPIVPKNLEEEIRLGRSITIPEIDAEFTPSEKVSRRLKKKDLEKFIKDEKRRSIEALEREEAIKNATMLDSDEIIISKYHMQTDLDTVKSRIEYRKQRYIQDLKRARYTFGEETLKSEKKHIAESKKLRKMKKHTRRFIRFTKKNNERYFALANLNVENIKVRSDVKRDRLEVLKNRILSLLIERDEVNMRLLTLYADENANPEKKRKTQRDRIDKIKRKASRREYRKQRFLYKEAASFRVPLAQKDRIYEVMNRKIELRAYLAECKYRKRHEHPGNKRAKRAIKKQIKNTKKRLKYAERDLDILMTKASRRSKRTPNPKIQFLWLLLIVAILALCVFGVSFALSNKDGIINLAKKVLKYGVDLIKPYIPENFSLR